MAGLVGPVIRLGHLTGAQARAFRIADNQIALNAGWDDTVLAAELARLREDGVDLDLLGFGEDDLDRLLDGLAGDGEGGQTDEDEVPEPPVAPGPAFVDNDGMASTFRASSARSYSRSRCSRISTRRSAPPLR